MKAERLLISASTSILVGIVQWIFSITCFAYIVVYEPWTMWFIANGVTGQSLTVLTYLVSFLVGVVLFLPGAYAICKFKPRKLVLYTALAILPYILWESRFLFSESNQLFHLVPWYSFVFGLLFGPSIFVAAVFLVYRLTRRSSSFRPSASTGRSSAAPLN